jgi:hypothetical protein
MTALDNRVRLHIYERFVADGVPPSVSGTGEALGIGREEAEAAYRRLEQDHIIVLAPGTLNIWLANPLCSTPSSFEVEAGSRSRWAVCIWDALGIPAMLGMDATISTRCPDCQEHIELVVRDSRLEPADAVIHFAVPAARWWENIAFT